MAGLAGAGKRTKKANRRESRAKKKKTQLDDDEKQDSHRVEDFEKDNPFGKESRTTAGRHP